jgi:hypothetical protein
MLKKISLTIALLAMVNILSPLMSQPAAADDSSKGTSQPVQEKPGNRPRPKPTPGPPDGGEED